MTQSQPENVKEAGKESAPTITLKVEHVRLEPGQAPPEFTFPQQTKVGDAATEAAVKLGYSSQGTYTFSFQGVTLDRNRPLVSFGLKNGDTVVLTDISRGV